MVIVQHRLAVRTQARLDGALQRMETLRLWAAKQVRACCASPMQLSVLCRAVQATHIGWGLLCMTCGCRAGFFSIAIIQSCCSAWQTCLHVTGHIRSEQGPFYDPFSLLKLCERRLHCAGLNPATAVGTQCLP